MKEYKFESFDGKMLNVTEWNDVDEPIGMVQIAHGMCEHARRYSKLADFLNSRGYIVFADDHRAHGKTDPDSLGKYKDGDLFVDTVKDIASISKHYIKEYPNLKLILLGHSYGSFLSQSYIERFSKNIDGVILTGSANMKGIEVIAGRFLAFLTYKFKGWDKTANLINKITMETYNNKFTNKSFISSLDNEVERYNKDKMCGFTCSSSFYRWFFKGLMDIYKDINLQEIPKDLPINILSGSLDPIGKNGKLVKKLKKLYDNLDITKVEMTLYEGCRHEIFNDTYAMESMQNVAKFCDEIKKRT